MISEETVMRISRLLNEPKWLLNERLRAFHIFRKLLSAEKTEIAQNYCVQFAGLSVSGNFAAKKPSGKFEGVHADSLYDMLESKDWQDAIAQNMFKNRMGNPIRGIDEAFVGAFFTECNFFGTDSEGAGSEDTGSEEGDGALGTKTKFSASLSNSGGISLNFFIVSSGTGLDCSIESASRAGGDNFFGINEFYVFDEADVLFRSKVDCRNSDRGNTENASNCINPTHLNFFAVNKSASATVRSLYLSAANSRTEVMLFGDGAEADIKESFAISNGNHEAANISSSITHLASNTNSSVTINGALDGNAHATVRGKISIPKNIKSATSFLEERVLLLSEEASAEAIPLLEIESNDVDVGHSASVSDITDEQMFYARSRGMNEAGIRKMILEGVEKFHEFLEN